MKRQGQGKGIKERKKEKSVRVEFILIFIFIFVLIFIEGQKEEEQSKKKGCDDFDLGKLPGPGGILEWTDEVRYKITAANKGDPDETVRVLRMLEKTAKLEETCPDCPTKFQKMDIKLALALNKIATGEYKTKLKQLTLQRRNEDKAVTGFQAYYLLLVMFNVTLDRWGDVLNKLTTSIPDEQLEVMFWEQVQQCKDLEFIWTQ
eukprot:2024315-Amphidinium_carterae.1